MRLDLPSPVFKAKRHAITLLPVLRNQCQSVVNGSPDELRRFAAEASSLAAMVRVARQVADLGRLLLRHPVFLRFGLQPWQLTIELPRSSSGADYAGRFK